MTIHFKMRLWALLVSTLTTLSLGGCTDSTFSGSAGKKATTNTTKGKPGTPGNPGNNTTDKTDKGNDPPGTTTLDKGHPNPDTQKDSGGPLGPGTAGDKGSPGMGTDQAGNTPIRYFDDGFPGVYAIKPLDPQRKPFIWAVTVDGKVTYLKLDDNDAVVGQKHWSNAVGGVGGTRTYVLEGGAIVIARTGGYLFFIDPDKTPEGDLKTMGSPTFYKFGAVGDNGQPPKDELDRFCLVSYRRDKKRYIGAAWGLGNFTEFPQNNTAPYAPQWETISNHLSAGPAQWGYSCGVDQDRLIYYSQWPMMSEGPIQAIDLTKLAAVTPSDVAPNGNFSSDKLAPETVGPKPQVGKGSYAMGIDRDGNVFNGTQYYTMGFEPKSRAIWGSGMGNGQLGIFPQSCLTKDNACTGYATFNTQQMGFQVGPISSLGDGHMVGMVRSVGTVMLMSLKNPKDITQGINATPIAQLGGDPYMYTDFTGATLYLTNAETTFELPNDGTRPNSAVGFAWANNPTGPTAWTDIKFEVRCYQDGGTKPDYDTANADGSAFAVKDALLQTFIVSKTCKGNKYNRVDVRLTQLNDGDSLMNVRKMQVTAYQ